MNPALSKFARDTIKDGLAKLTDGQRHMFGLMYVTRTGKHGETFDQWATIDEVVDRMPDEKLDWAMRQVENTIKKNEIPPRG